MRHKTVILEVSGGHFDLFLACSWVSKNQRSGQMTTKLQLLIVPMGTKSYWSLVVNRPLLRELGSKNDRFFMFFFPYFASLVVIIWWCFCIHEKSKITILGWVTKIPKKKKYTKTTQKSIRICLVHILMSWGCFWFDYHEFSITWIFTKINTQHSNWCPENCCPSNMLSVICITTKNNFQKIVLSSI